MSDDNDTNPFGAFLSGFTRGAETRSKIDAAKAGGGEKSILNPAGPGASPAASTANPAGAAPTSDAQSPSAKLTNLNASAGAVYNGLVARGFTPSQAAAITGNIQAESGFKTGIEGDKGLPGGSSFGLMQWREGRLTNLKNLAASQGKDWRDLNVQLDHIKAEALGGDRGFANWYKTTQGGTDVGDLTRSFAAQVERPSAAALAKSLPHRIGAATTAFGMYGKGGPVPAAQPAPQQPDGAQSSVGKSLSIFSTGRNAIKRSGGGNSGAPAQPVAMNPAAAGLNIVTDADVYAPYMQGRGILQAYV